MINSSDIQGILTDEIPELGKLLPYGKEEGDLYKCLKAFTKYTHAKMYADDEEAIQNCFKVAGRLYRNGNNRVKTAIENTFVYTVSDLAMTGSGNYKELKQRIPATLYTLYINQMSCSAA